MGRRRTNIILNVYNTLPIDQSATRAAVEQRLEEVRQYRQLGFIRQEVSMTPSYL